MHIHNQLRTSQQQYSNSFKQKQWLNQNQNQLYESSKLQKGKLSRRREAYSINQLISGKRNLQKEQVFQQKLGFSRFVIEGQTVQANQSLDEQQVKRNLNQIEQILNQTKNNGLLKERRSSEISKSALRNRFERRKVYKSFQLPLMQRFNKHVGEPIRQRRLSPSMYNFKGKLKELQNQQTQTSQEIKIKVEEPLIQPTSQEKQFDIYHSNKQKLTEVQLSKQRLKELTSKIHTKVYSEINTQLVRVKARGYKWLQKISKYKKLKTHV